MSFDFKVFYSEFYYNSLVFNTSVLKIIRFANLLHEMPVTNPAVCKFLAESYDKIERQQRKWKNQNTDKESNVAASNKDDKDCYKVDNVKDAVVNNKNITEELASPKRHRHVKRELEVNRVFGILEMKRHTIPESDIRAAKDDVRSDSDKDTRIMRPVDPEHSNMIYKDSPSNGREHYLRVRSRMKPDEKYYYHQCSSWEYGWKLRDSYFGKHVAPTYGRSHLFTRDGMSRSGPQPDPYYYKWPKQKLQGESTNIQYHAA